MPPQTIWEPACWRGAISRVLRKVGHQVIESDINYYGQPLVRDFFKLTSPLAPVIITNPPFSGINNFVRHALSLCPKVIILARLTFLAGTRRTDIIEGGALRKVLVFANRLPMMHRDGWTGPIATSTVDYAWFIFNPDCGSTTIERLHCTETDINIDSLEL